MTCSPYPVRRAPRHSSRNDVCRCQGIKARTYVSRLVAAYLCMYYCKVSLSMLNQTVRMSPASEMRCLRNTSKLRASRMSTIVPSDILRLIVENVFDFFLFVYNFQTLHWIDLVSGGGVTCHCPATLGRFLSCEQ